MKAKVLRALAFLRLTDEKHNLSLTNIALVIVLIRLLCVPSIDIQSLAAFMGTLISYQAKRWIQPNTTQDDAAELKAAIASLQTKVTGLQMGQKLNR